MKPSGIGGMAVMEGVMMKNQDTYAVAVRKPNNEIVVEKNTQKSFSDKVKLFKLPIFRGMLVFVESLVIGIKVLNFSASFFEDEEEEDKKKKNNEQQSNALLMALAVILSIGMSIALFMVLPVLISSIFSKLITNPYALALVEGLIRITIFIGYVLAASQMKEIKRVFMYHGAEHKTINCLENGFELTVENVRFQSKQNKRCGTSFMLFVMIISLIIFIFLPSGNLAWRILSRVLLIPVISGISYEFIRLAGRTDNVVLDILSKPGLLMQGLTTKEPDDSMIEVAIKSVETIFDWQAFLESSDDEKKEDKQTSKATVNKNNKLEKNLKSNNSKNSAKGNTEVVGKANKAGKKAKEETAATLEHKDAEDDDILKALDKYLDF
ncbi:MAG: DUF1385 domain-containing protein [Clostridiales bacterium]|nr:DUF1385 domain-containing protein [Clostridiales bacterium]